jgi:hypothetical protein
MLPSDREVSVIRIAIAAACLVASVDAWAQAPNWLPNWLKGGSDKPEPIVVLDSWSSESYAKAGCELTIRDVKKDMADKNYIFPEVMTLYQACLIGGDPVGQARSFEDDLMTQIAITPSCKGATFAAWYGSEYYGKSGIPAATLSAMDKRHWTLTIEYNAGLPEQAWRLEELEIHTKGKGAPSKIAADVCAIVMGRGGTLAR